MATQRVTRFLSVLLLVPALLASPAAAQSTRTEEIAGQQAEKAKSLGTEGPSDAERIIRQVLLSPLLSGGDGVYPWFGSVYSGTGMGLGVGYLERLQKAAFFNVQAGLSINGSMVLRGTFAAPELWRVVQFNANAQWLEAKGVSYYGFGQDSLKENRETFDFAPKDIGVNATVKPLRNVFVTGSYTFVNFDTTRETPMFPPEQSPGMNEELNFHVTRATIAYDWRQSPGYATRGGYYRAAFEHNEESAGLPYNFNLQEYEVVQLVPLVREQFVFAVRGLATLADPQGNQEIPVMLTPILGSGSTLRGYSNRRFADRNRVLLTGEYRWRPSRYLDMALFYDTGMVARDPSEFTFSKFDSAWGLGARFHGPAFTAFRVEIARGREGIRLVFAGSQPF
jgi:hypothetical protein